MKKLLIFLGFLPKQEEPTKEYIPTVTMGWDLYPTILCADGKIYSRSAELIFHKAYYPNWPEEKWPVDPKTGKKLEQKD